MSDDELAELLELREEEAAPTPPGVVCRCSLVTEREVADLFARGATIEEVTRRTGAGATCASCLPLLRHLAAIS